MRGRGERSRLLLHLNGCGAKYILFTLSFCGISFEVWFGLSHRACCLALPKVSLSSNKDWVGGGCCLASEVKRKGYSFLFFFLTIVLEFS